MKPVITIDASGLQKLIAKMDKATSAMAKTKAMNEAGLLLERCIALKTPVRTGVAKGSIKLKSYDATRAIVSSSLNYVPGLEEGTRAHVIRPKNAKVLAFNAGGGKVFTKMVHHPGTKGRHMFRDGLLEAAPKVPAILEKHLGFN